MAHEERPEKIGEPRQEPKRTPFWTEERLLAFGQQQYEEALPFIDPDLRDHPWLQPVMDREVDDRAQQRRDQEQFWQELVRMAAELRAEREGAHGGTR